MLPNSFCDGSEVVVQDVFSTRETGIPPTFGISTYCVVGRLAVDASFIGFAVVDATRLFGELIPDVIT